MQPIKRIIEHKMELIYKTTIYYIKVNKLYINYLKLRSLMDTSIHNKYRWYKNDIV